MTLKNLNPVMPIMITPFPNGGFIVEQEAATFPAPPGSTLPRYNKLGAFTTADDLITALSDALIPQPASKFVLSETHLIDGWQPMEAAPRGNAVPTLRILDEEGYSHSQMKFTEPYWWDAPNGQLRLLDHTKFLYTAHNAEHGETLKAIGWKYPSAP